MGSQKNNRYMGVMAIVIGSIQMILAALTLALGIYWVILTKQASVVIGPAVSFAAHLIGGAVCVTSGARKTQNLITASTSVNSIVLLFSVAHTLLALYATFVIAVFGAVVGIFFELANEFAWNSMPYMFGLGMLLFFFTLWASILGCVYTCCKKGQGQDDVEMSDRRHETRADKFYA